MSYIKSSKIEVFPVAKQRHESAPGTRIFTEKNISNLSRQLLSEDKPGYIISCKSNEENNNAFDISFNLYGYYFNIKGILPSDIEGNGDSIYASMTIDQADEILGQDVKILGQDVYEYQGLALTKASTTPENTVDKKYIKLFESTDEVWKCSSQNFGIASALVIGGIDGKHS